MWCSKPLSVDHPEATLEHVIPRSRLGSHRLENLILACSHCNNARRDVGLVKWMQECQEQGLDIRRELLKAASDRVSQSPKAKRSQIKHDLERRRLAEARKKTAVKRRKKRPAKRAQSRRAMQEALSL